MCYGSKTNASSCQTNNNSTSLTQKKKIQKKVSVVFGICPPQMLLDPNGDLKKRGKIHLAHLIKEKYGATDNDEKYDYKVYIDCGDLIYDTCSMHMYTYDGMMKKLEEAIEKLKPFLNTLIIYGENVHVKIDLAVYYPIEGLAFGFCSLFKHVLKNEETNKYKDFIDYATTLSYHLNSYLGFSFGIPYVAFIELVGLYQESDEERAKRIAKEVELRREAERQIQEENERIRKQAEWENQSAKNHWVLGAIAVAAVVVVVVVCAPVAIAAIGAGGAALAAGGTATAAIGAATAAGTAMAGTVGAAATISTATAIGTAALASDLALHVVEASAEVIHPDLKADLEGHAKGAAMDTVFLLLSWERVVSVFRANPLLESVYWSGKYISTKTLNSIYNIAKLSPKNIQALKARQSALSSDINKVNKEFDSKIRKYTSYRKDDSVQKFRQDYLNGKDISRDTAKTDYNVVANEKNWKQLLEDLEPYRIKYSTLKTELDLVDKYMKSMETRLKLSKYAQFLSSPKFLTYLKDGSPYNFTKEIYGDYLSVKDYVQGPKYTIPEDRMITEVPLY